MVAGVVGLGLMGGSLALELKELDFVKKVVGYDKNEKHKKEALELKLIEEAVDLDTIQKCDLIILAIPVEGIIETLKSFKNIKSDSTIIDLGSTKEKIVKSVPEKIRKNFVAAHPMTGTEKFGPKAAFKGLYKDKIVVVCDIEKSGEHQKNVAIRLFESIGMQIVYMEAAEHDRHAAYISHLPHAISYALANSVLGQEDPKSILILAAGGFKDMSRLAKSSPKMWSDIFKQNRENLLDSIDSFKKELKIAENLLKEENWEELRKWMEKATTLHDIL